jgi:hypothetical protein
MLQMNIAMLDHRRNIKQRQRGQQCAETFNHHGSKMIAPETCHLSSAMVVERTLIEQFTAIVWHYNATPNQPTLFDSIKIPTGQSDTASSTQPSSFMPA